MTLLSALVCLGLTACGGDTKLVDAQTKWKSQALTSYRFDYSRNCFCPDSGTVYVVRVQNGAVTTVTEKATGTPVDAKDLSSFPTIDAIFITIDKADHEAASLSVTYDAAMGFPTAVSIDWIAEAVDDEVSMTIGPVTSLVVP